MLKLIVIVALSSLGQNQIFVDVLEGLRRHGYPDVVADQAIDEACESLAKLIAMSPEKAHEKGINAHLAHLLESHGVSDATYWTSIVHGSKVVGDDILKDILPKLNRAFKPNRIGMARYQVGHEVFIVSVLVHRAGELKVEVTGSKVAPQQMLTGHLYAGYFQPRVLVASANGLVTEYTLRLDTDRRFKLVLPTDLNAGMRVELVAEHVSGPRVLHLFDMSGGQQGRRLPVIRMERPSTLQPQMELYQRVNQIRRARDLVPLNWKESLAGVAETHATWIAARRALTHKAHSHGHLRQRLAAQSMRPSYMSELLVSAESVLEAIEAIKTSPAHFREIGRQRVNTIGIGVDNGYYVVILAWFEPAVPEVD